MTGTLFKTAQLTLTHVRGPARYKGRASNVSSCQLFTPDQRNSSRACSKRNSAFLTFPTYSLKAALLVVKRLLQARLALQGAMHHKVVSPLHPRGHHVCRSRHRDHILLLDKL